MTENMAFLVPVKGLIEVFYREQPFDPQWMHETLRARNATGSPLTLNIIKDGEAVGRALWFVHDLGLENRRAREAFVLLCGSHMIFPGPVMFSDVDPEKVSEIVATLSRKE